MIVGYARTSTLDQTAGLDAQRRDLTKAGAEEIFAEHVSSVAADRPQLAAAMQFCRKGDVLAVSKLDRLARSVTDLWRIVEALRGKGVAVRVLDNTGLDTSTAAGAMLFTILGAVAQFERAVMLERQREGIAAAKAAGRYKGRKPLGQEVVAEVRRLHALGTPKAQIARDMTSAGRRVSERSVYAILGRAV